MKKILIWVLLLSSIVAIILLFFCSRPVKIINTTPADQLLTKNHGLEKLLLTEAIFYVRHGFREVSAKELAKEVGLKLECKRQVSETQYYYVVEGSGYRCFIITNDSDIVQEVFVTRDFATIAETQEWLELWGEEKDIAEDWQNGYHDVCRYIGGSSRYRNELFTLQDGVMIRQWCGINTPPQYFYFTDEEWQNVYREWDGFVILPIDKH